MSLGSSAQNINFNQEKAIDGAATGMLKEETKKEELTTELTREELRLIDQGQYENKYGDEKIDYEEAIKMTPIEEEEALGFQF